MKNAIPIFSPSESILLQMVLRIVGVFTLIFCLNLTLIAQLTIRGTIRSSDDNSPLVGATVLIKNTSNGTTSDFDGTYEINVPSGQTTLVYTFTGYTTQEVVVGNQTMIDVILATDIAILDQVLVTGYGVQKKANLSGAVDNVTVDQLESRPINNLAQGLQGVSPNLNIDFNSGTPGEPAKINIRGFTSVNGGSPLILIDGVPSDEIELNRLAPQDVESISVLKDASSAAIYGARAAFGVIIITTKSGTGEGLHVNYTNNFSISNPTIIGDKITDPYIYLRLKETSTDNTPWDNFNFTDEQYAWAKQRSENPSVEGVRMDPTDPSRWAYMGNQDWTEQFLVSTQSQQHQLALSGRNKHAQYYFSGSYNNTNGALDIADDYFDRYTLRSKVNFQLSDRLSIGNNTYITLTDRTHPSYLDIFNLYNFEPTDYMQNPDGSWAATEVGREAAQLSDGGTMQDRYSSFQTTLTGELKLIKDVLSLNADFTNRRGNSNFSRDYKKYVLGFGPGNFREEGSNEATRSSTNDVYDVFNVYGTFSRRFGLSHQLTAIAGFNQEYFRSEYFSAHRIGIISSSLPTIALATGDPTVDEYIADWAVRGAFYRLNYILADRYIIELNGRYDGSSRFPKNERWGFFPSASVAWRLDREAFLINSAIISQLKLRASYGSLGNQSVSEYGYIPNLEAQTGRYIIDGKLPERIVAPPLVSANYSWENVSTLNGGIDLGFLQDRLLLSFDIYKRNTIGMLTQGRDLPDVLGAREPSENAADLTTKGWELSLDFRNRFALAGKPLHFDTRIVLSDSRTQITKFDNPNGNLNQFYEGMELGEIWGLTSDGLFQSEEEISALDQTSLIPWGALNIVPGWPKYVDLDGNGAVEKGLTTEDPKDLSVIGNIMPRYRFGVNLGAEWSGFDLSVFLQGVGKRDYYPQDYLFWGFYQQPYAGGYSHLTDFYRPADDSQVQIAKHSQSYVASGLASANTENPRYPILQAWLADRNLGERIDESRGLAVPQTGYLLNGSFLRLKNLTLGYRLPQNLLEKANITGLRIYVSGENLTEWSGVKEFYDPEAITSVDDKLDPTSSTSRGTGSGFAYPFQRRYSLGINLDF